MEIHAKSVMDERTLRAAQALAIFGKKEPKQSFRRRVACYILLSALMILFAVLLWEEPFFRISCPICAALCLGGILLTLYTDRIMPQRAYRKSPLADAENLYVFGEDALVVSTTGRDGFYATETRPYSMIIRLTETADFFFLYLDKMHMYAVDKATISETDIREIRCRILAFPSVRHVICRY